jgi:hypothetical protein
MCRARGEGTHHFVGPSKCDVHPPRDGRHVASYSRGEALLTQKMMALGYSTELVK